MCGIAGFVSYTSPPDADSVLVRMTDSLRHRGPDDSAVYSDTMAFLGHRRLSIIDLAAGRQPMSNEQGDIWVTYNGEVFNHLELRRELERAGHTYKTHCDTETILHAYEEFGPDCARRLRGMFAFALWDRQSRTLFCARDRMGIKPFYYFWDGRVFAFASEIKALLQHPAISAALNERLLPEYLAFGYTSGEETLFAGIRKLMPGHHLTLQLNQDTPRVEIRQYWDVPRSAAEVESRPDEFWISECRRRLENAVESHLMSDVPLGVFLSGGLDCSAIAALMTRMVPGPIQTFSVGYAESAYSELGFARKVSSLLGTEHHEVVIGMKDVFDALPSLIWHEDEPIAWPSSVAHYFVSRLASRNVKVVLTGDGSDELFAGYERYTHYLFNRRWMARYGVVPATSRAWLRNHIAESPLFSGELRRKLRHTFLGREDTLESLQLDNFYCAFSTSEQQRLLSSLSDQAAPYRSFREYWDTEPQPSLLSRMLYADQKTYLVELLMKQDQMSMACSIESRVPYLDAPLVDFAAQVPPSLKLRNGTTKYILKKAVEDLLPDNIVNRRKMGFPTPIRYWLQNGNAGAQFEVARSRNGLLGSYFDMREVDGLIERHQHGREDATDRIWRLITLQMWGEVFLSGSRKEAPEAPASV